MLWIMYRKGEVIPKELYYKGWQTDKDHMGYAPLRLWIIYRGGETIFDQTPLTI